MFPENAAALSTGASNENMVSADVPVIALTVITAVESHGYMLHFPLATGHAVRHASDVELIHDTVRHATPPSAAVGDPYVTPNDSPVTVTLVPPLVAKFGVLPRFALATGAS